MAFLTAVNSSSLCKLPSALAAEGVDCGSCGYGQLHKAPLYTGVNSPFGRKGPFNNPYWENFVPSASLPNTETLNGSAFLGAPRFEYENEPYVELYAEVYKKLKDNVDELVKYDREHTETIIKNNGRSINKVK